MGNTVPTVPAFAPAPWAVTGRSPRGSGAAPVAGASRAASTGRLLHVDRRILQNAVRNVLDGELLNRYLYLSTMERGELAKKIGTTPDIVSGAGVWGRGLGGVGLGCGAGSPQPHGAPSWLLRPTCTCAPRRGVPALPAPQILPHVHVYLGSLPYTLCPTSRTPCPMASPPYTLCPTERRATFLCPTRCGSLPPPHPQHLFLPPQILEDLLEIDRVTAHF